MTQKQLGAFEISCDACGKDLGFSTADCEGGWMACSLECGEKASKQRHERMMLHEFDCLIRYANLTKLQWYLDRWDATTLEQFKQRLIERSLTFDGIQTSWSVTR